MNSVGHWHKNKFHDNVKTLNNNIKNKVAIGWCTTVINTMSFRSSVFTANPTASSHPKPHTYCLLFGSFLPFHLFSVDWWFWHGCATVSPDEAWPLKEAHLVFHRNRGQTCQRVQRNITTFSQHKVALELPTGWKLWFIPNILINSINMWMIWWFMAFITS